MQSTSVSLITELKNFIARDTETWTWTALNTKRITLSICHYAHVHVARCCFTLSCCHQPFIRYYKKYNGFHMICNWSALCMLGSWQSTSFNNNLNVGLYTYTLASQITTNKLIEIMQLYKAHHTNLHSIWPPRTVTVMSWFRLAFELLSPIDPFHKYVILIDCPGIFSGILWWSHFECI